MREWTIRVTGPHCGTILVGGTMTYPEAEAKVAEIKKNRHAREVEIVRA